MTLTGFCKKHMQFVTSFVLLFEKNHWLSTFPLFVHDLVPVIKLIILFYLCYKFPAGPTPAMTTSTNTSNSTLSTNTTQPITTTPQITTPQPTTPPLLTLPPTTPLPTTQSPTFPVPTTPPGNVSSEWKLAESEIVFQEGDMELALLVSRSGSRDGYQGVLLVTCCAAKELNTSPKYSGLITAAVATVDVPPARSINWTAASGI